MGKRKKLQRRIKNFQGDGYVRYLNNGDGFTGIHICQNLLNCVL